MKVSGYDIYSINMREKIVPVFGSAEAEMKSKVDMFWKMIYLNPKIERLIERLIDWLIVCLNDWLIDWLIDWLVGWLVGW